MMHERRVLHRGEGATDEVARRVAEREPATSPTGGCTQEPRVVRVAAHDSVQHHQVGSLHRLRCLGHVDDASMDPVRDTRLLRQAARLLVVRRGQLRDRGRLRAPPQQLDADLADTTADLEDRRSGQVVLRQEVDHLAGCRIDTAAPVALRHPAREPLAEHVLVSLRVTTPSHPTSIHRFGRRRVNSRRSLRARVPHGGSQGRHRGGADARRPRDRPPGRGLAGRRVRQRGRGRGGGGAVPAADRDLHRAMPRR